MNDTEFIELLNLYLDHEIAPEDAARLEAEVQRNPERYRIYQDYCRMQKACTLLAADFTTETPTVVAFESEARRGLRPSFYAVGGLMAAAACVAFVFLNRSAPVAPASGPVVVENAALVPDLDNSGVRGIARTVSVPARRDDFQAVLAAHTLRLTDNPAATDAAQLVRLDWIEQMQLSSLPRISEAAFRFEEQAPLKAAPRSFSSGQSQTALESAAWQFQR